MQGKVSQSEKKSVQPKESAGSFDSTAVTHKAASEHVVKLISNIPVKPPAITSIKAKSKEAKFMKQTAQQTPLSDQSFLSQSKGQILVSS